MEFRRLHEGFGAEVIGFDPLRPSTSEEIETLRTALDEYQLLLIRCDQRINPNRQVEISSWFGPICESGDNQWYMLQNDETGGSRRLPFHADLSYTDTPIKGLSLHAVEIPPAGTSTAFISGIHAWATLPPERQSKLAHLTLRHRYTPMEAVDWPEFIADHPVRLTHPRTGQPILYVTEHHATRIHELDLESSDRLIAELLRHLYAPAQIYEQRWRRYDFMIWDNLAIQHARPETAELAHGVRAMQRVQLCETPFAEIIEHARQVEKARQLQAI